jgi:hypothetical protein
VIFIFWFTDGKISNFSIAFAKKSLDSLKSKVYSPFLPNLSGYGFCMGNVKWQCTGSLTEQANMAIARVWGSTFNNDQTSQFEQQCRANSAFESLATWQAKSAENPLFILNTDWHTGSNEFQTLLGDGSNEVKAVFKPIIESVVSGSATKLRDVFATEKGEESDKQLKRATEIFRTELYDIMYGACNEVATKIEANTDQTALQMLAALQRQIEQAQGKGEEKDGEGWAARPSWDRSW